LRRVAHLTAVLLAGLACGAPDSRGQEPANSDNDQVAPKKHYLTFQVSYFGTAQRSGSDASGRSETSMEVNDRFTGRVEVRPTEAYDLPRSAEAQIALAAAIQAAVLAGDAEKTKAVTPASLVTWFPHGDQVEITGTISETKATSASETEHGETRASSDQGTESYKGQKVFGGSLVNAFVKIRAEEKRYDLQFTLMPDMASTGEAVHQTLVSDHREEGHNSHSESEANVPLDMGPGQMALGYSNYQIVAEVKGQPFGSDAGELTGATRIPVPKPAGWDGSWDVGLLVSWQLEIAPPPYRLEIEVPANYAKWRPTTTPTVEAGEALAVTARVVALDGSTPTVKVVQFEWTLQDTSREPGVTLNFPVNATDDRYDLELSAEGPGVVLAESKQRVTRREPQGRSDTVKVVPFDWGGWSTLQVTAVLEGGRRLTGRLKTENGDGLRVPKRAANSSIADGWKDATGAQGADTSDRDNAPVGDGTKGDGLSLYEEYRGFYDAGQRLEGDPKKKDFFIYLKQAGLAIGGIQKFQRATELKVHYKFTDQEFPESRIINANRDRGPSVTDQHGVVVQISKTQKAFYIANGGPGNPKVITTVDLVADAAAEDPHELRSSVAHELGHCVNIWHHGESDGKVYWVEDRGKLYETLRNGTMPPTIRVFAETFDELTAEAVAEAAAADNHTLIVVKGQDQGQHSGADLCFMCYDNAQTYKFREDPSFRFWHFANPIGDSLCTKAAGSGVNEPGRFPQSRYGPARAGRGDCFHQILVTDAVVAPARGGTATAP
jgi:hypothetical protein